MNKVAIVTGGSRGIGQAIAARLLKLGYAVAILDLNSEESVAAHLEDLKSLGELLYFRGSTTSAEDRSAFIAEVMRRYGRIDVLVNNAGVAPKVRQDLLSATEESFDFVVGVNVKGTMFMTQAVVNEMLKQPVREDGIRSVIVNISSFSQFVSSPNRPEYCISKAGVSMLTRLFADRLASDSIFVYEVQPGVIRTDMTATVQEKYDRLLQGSEFPIHRWGTPEDVANVVTLFTDGQMTYTTGQVIHVDGGYMNIRTI